MKVDEFLERVKGYADLENENEALQMTEVFLSTMGEWMYWTETRKLASQLPKEIKDFLYQRQKPEQTKAEVARRPVGGLFHSTC